MILQEDQFQCPKVSRVQNWRKVGVSSAGDTAQFPNSSLQSCLFPRQLFPFRSPLWSLMHSFLLLPLRCPPLSTKKIRRQISLWNFLEIAIQHNLQWLLGDSGTQGFSTLEFLFMSCSHLSCVTLMLNVTKHLCIKYHNNYHTSVPALDSRKPRVPMSLIKV